MRPGTADLKVRTCFTFQRRTCRCTAMCRIKVYAWAGVSGFCAVVWLWIVVASNGLS